MSESMHNKLSAQIEELWYSVISAHIAGSVGYSPLSSELITQLEKALLFALQRQLSNRFDRQISIAMWRQSPRQPVGSVAADSFVGVHSLLTPQVRQLRGELSQVVRDSAVYDAHTPSPFLGTGEHMREGWLSGQMRSWLEESIAAQGEGRPQPPSA